MIIQTNYSATLDILQQSSIIAIVSTMRLNLRHVKISQFLQQFTLNIRHKPGKNHIIPDVLDWLASMNCNIANSSYLELDVLFIYNTTLIEICPTLVARIITGYNANVG